MNKIEDKLNKEKCEDTLYGELLTAKLKKLPYHHRLRVKHDIDNIMLKYMCIDCVPEKESQSFSPVINPIAQPSQCRSATTHSLKWLHLPIYPLQKSPTDHNQLVKIWLVVLFFKGKGTT